MCIRDRIRCHSVVGLNAEKPQTVRAVQRSLRGSYFLLLYKRSNLIPYSMYLIVHTFISNRIWYTLAHKTMALTLWLVAHKMQNGNLKLIFSITEVYWIILLSNQLLFLNFSCNIPEYGF